jgi:hypothetical protein
MAVDRCAMQKAEYKPDEALHQANVLRQLNGLMGAKALSLFAADVFEAHV